MRFVTAPERRRARQRGASSGGAGGVWRMSRASASASAFRVASSWPRLRRCAMMSVVSTASPPRTPASPPWIFAASVLRWRPISCSRAQRADSSATRTASSPESPDWTPNAVPHAAHLSSASFRTAAPRRP
ncbi:MAG TPA: hypothetical protein VFV71_01650 [Burkholderiales bacterium]|nr:hypothetical protein [Burkholderiales bacterium]